MVIPDKVMEGLKILAGEILPDGYVFTSDNGKDMEQIRAMVRWLNETELPDSHITNLGGGDYYGYAVEMAKRIMEQLGVLIKNG